MSEAIIMDNTLNNNLNNTSNDVTSSFNFSLPSEMSTISMLNKNVMTNNNNNNTNKEVVNTKTTFSNLAFNMQTNNLVFQKEEAALGSLCRNIPNNNYNCSQQAALMNASYVVSSSHTPKSLPSSLSYASQNSPINFDFLTNKNMMNTANNVNNNINNQFCHNVNINWPQKMSTSYFSAQNHLDYFQQDPESLHSLKHSNINNNNTNNNNNIKPSGIALKCLIFKYYRFNNFRLY